MPPICYDETAMVSYHTWQVAAPYCVIRHNYQNLMMPYGDIYILVNTGSSNGLMPNDTKPLPEPVLTYHQ